MQTLSTDDGSAEAVRVAAEAALAHGDNRGALERELDRLNTAIQGSAAALGAHLSWMLVAQGFLLTAYIVLLVVGWNVPLPGKRWLLAGIAAFAVLAVAATYLGLRAARDRVGPLKLQRQRIEDALERVAGRPPAFARQGAFTALLANASTRGLPLLVCAGWTAVALYTLALPMPTDAARAAVTPEARPAAVVPAAAASKPGRSAVGSGAAKGTPEVGTASATPDSKTAAKEESGLLGLLRRAVNGPAAADGAEPVKP